MKKQVGLILPNRDGVSSLEIQRMRRELEAGPKPLEMAGHMPAALVEPAISALRAVITAIERGEVSSLCVITILPQSSRVDDGRCFISAVGDELEQIDELFHVSLAEQYANTHPGTTPDEAG